jgi:hypothetical protein
MRIFLHLAQNKSTSKRCHSPRAASNEVAGDLRAGLFCFPTVADCSNFRAFPASGDNLWGQSPKVTTVADCSKL